MAMKIKLVGVVAPLALFAGLAFGTAANAAGPMNAWKSSSNETVMNPYKECWQGVGGVASPECGGDELDSDGDGVPDSRDKCPNTPKGAPVDADGCPLDSDGDGVPDYRDKCPNTRSGAKVDEWGCEIMADITIDLVNDEFAFDSAKLKPDMKKALDDVAAKVKATPGDEHLTIIGHTDSVGSDAYNQRLSERRAKSTKDYLVKKGVAGDHITTAGRGESQPIADNKTKAGRAKNRRVEITTK